MSSWDDHMFFMSRRLVSFTKFRKLPGWVWERILERDEMLKFREELRYQPFYLKAYGLPWWKKEASRCGYIG